MKLKYPGELVFFSVIAGGIASPLKLIVHHIFEWTGLATPFYSHLITFLIHGHRGQMNFIDSVFAGMGDIALGAIFGIVLAFWLLKSRPQYHWWIGLGYGFGLWFISLVFGNLLKIIEKSQTTQWALLAHLLAMITFGLLFVLMTRVWKLLKRRLAGE